MCVDMDTFVIANSGTRREHVGRTYQGVHGYTPIAAYLGNEGWSVGLELRSGTHHSAPETEYFLDRVFPRIRRLMKGRHEPVLWRTDRGFHSARLLLALQAEGERWAAKQRSLDFVVKWNPRRQGRAGRVRRLVAEQAMKETRVGKRVGYCSKTVARSIGGGPDKMRRALPLVVEVAEWTSDKKGQHLLAREVELQGWWSTLDAPPEESIKLYKSHGTHEQFHSEIKTDLYLEPLPSGKFNTHDAVLHLGEFAYNCLRLLGELGFGGKITPVRHPSSRPRITSVLQEIMRRAANVAKDANCLLLHFGHGVAAHAAVFIKLPARLARACAREGPPGSAPKRRWRSRTSHTHAQGGAQRLQ